MDFLGIGPVEILLIVVIALIVLGPTRMMEMIRSLGRLMNEVRRTTRDLPNLLSLEEGPTRPSPKGDVKDVAKGPNGDDGEGRTGEGQR